MPKLSKLKYGLMAGCALTTTVVVAQENASRIEQIVVTAQQREQSVLDVPVTMDVIQGEFLDRTSTLELDDLSRFLPNVVIQEQGVSLPSFNIRGITDDTAAVTATPRISVYQDGFDISKKTVSSVALYDIERIEVLKGAQPTLFGAAASNGAVTMLSARPVQEFDAEGRLAFNNLDGVEFRGMVNVPINDVWAFRLAGMVRDQDGFIENTACSAGSYNPSGTIDDQNGVAQSCAGGDLNGNNLDALRATLLGDWGETSVLVRASIEDNDQPGISFKSGSIAPRNGDTSPFSDAELGLGSLLRITRDLETFDFAVTHNFNDNLQWVVDGYVKDVELSEYFDADGSGLRIQDNFFDNNADLHGYGTRLIFSIGDRFEGFVGYNETHDESTLPFIQMVDPVLDAALDARRAELDVMFPNVTLDSDQVATASTAEITAVRQMLVDALFNADGTPISDQTSNSTSINGPFVFDADLEIRSFFAEGSYALTDQLTVTAGVRFIDETRFSRDTFFGAFSAEAEADFDDVLPRLSLNYAYNDNLSLYFNYAEGRRSPVVDANPFGENTVVNAEIVDSFDVGAKYFDGNLSFTTALFAYTYQDFQQSFTNIETGESVTVTVGDSDMYGFEATLDYAISDNLSIGGSLGLLDAEFDNNTVAGSRFDYGGNTFRLAPDTSGALFFRYGFEVGSYALEWELISSYQSDVFFDNSNRPELSQDAYWITDTSIKFRPDSGRWTVELYADNLFDEEFLIDAGNTGGGFGLPTFVAGQPLIAGVRFYADY